MVNSNITFRQKKASISRQNRRLNKNTYPKKITSDFTLEITEAIKFTKKSPLALVP